MFFIIHIGLQVLPEKEGKDMRKYLSLILSAVMLFSGMTLTTFAEEESAEAEEPIAETETEEASEEEPATEEVSEDETDVEAEKAEELEEIASEEESDLEEAVYGDWEYEVGSDGTVTLTVYKGNGGTVELPSTIDGKTVTRLSANAFTPSYVPEHVLKSIIKLIIPASIVRFDEGWNSGTQFGYLANNFKTGGPIGSGCDVEYGWKEEIPDYAFSALAFDELTIPNGFKRIGKRAIAPEIKHLVIPESVVSVGDSEFGFLSDTDKDKTLTAGPIGSGCNIEFGWKTEIPDNAFAGAPLTKITIPEGITRIGKYALYGNGHLIEINLPNTLTKIDDHAMMSCEKLPEINLPKSLREIGENSFACCSSVTNLIIPDGVKKIGDDAFGTMSGLKKCEIADSVTEIGSGALSACFDLESVVIGKNVSSIPERMFSSCLNLTDVVMYSNVKSIGDRAFNETNTDLAIEFIGTEEQWLALLANSKDETVKQTPVVAVPTPEKEPAAGQINMYRMYNPTSGEHFYTGSKKERNTLIKAGWKYEGVGFKAPVKSNSPMYRLYNPNAGDHHYTASVKEKDQLVNAGWNYEGVGWYADDAKGVAQYRLYNPNAQSGSHHYTANDQERDNLKNIGWKYEGIGFYACK